MFLMSLQQSLSPSDISSKFICADETLHAAHPGHQVSVVTQEPLEVIRVQQFDLALVSLAAEVGPLLIDVLLLLVDNLRAVLVDVHQLACLLVQLGDLVTQSSKISLKTLVLPLKSLNSSQIMTDAVIVQCFILLSNPIFGLINISVEHLDLMSPFKSSSLFIGYFLQFSPLLIQVLQLRLNLHGGLSLSQGDQL